MDLIRSHQGQSPPTSGKHTSNLDRRFFSYFQEAEVYFANSDYVPTRPDGISLAENQLVDVLDSHDPEQYLVRTRARKDERSKIGWVDACFLEKKSTNIGQVCSHTAFFFSLLTQIITDIVVVVAAAAAAPSTDFSMFSRKSVILHMRRVLSFVDIQQTIYSYACV